MRKLLNFARRVKPQKASQMTQCLGAGTGCGWCIPILKKIAHDPDQFQLEEITPEQYEQDRKTYRTKPQEKNTFDYSHTE